MPDVGCGVYQNDAKEIGRLFGEVLTGEFWGHFSQVVVVGKRDFQDAVEKSVQAASREVPQSLPSLHSTPQAGVASPVPGFPGWESVFSEAHQRLYYVNRATGERCWELPHTR